MICFPRSGTTLAIQTLQGYYLVSELDAQTQISNHSTFEPTIPLTIKMTLTIAEVIAHGGGGKKGIRTGTEIHQGNISD